MPFSRPISDRYFEDYVEGDVHLFGTIAIGADEIVTFAKQFERRPRAAPTVALLQADGTLPAS
jgi:hypothetical protein